MKQLNGRQSIRSGCENNKNKAINIPRVQEIQSIDSMGEEMKTIEYVLDCYVCGENCLPSEFFFAVSSKYGKGPIKTRFYCSKECKEKDK